MREGSHAAGSRPGERSIPTPDAARASSEAAAVARRHGLRVADLTEVEEHHAAANLFRGIWGLEMLQPGLIRAFAHTGNYVAGAYLRDELVAAAVGFLAADGHLHSHITAVAPGQQSRGAGYGLKLHQRAWALERGIETVRWTFDPLVRRNAYFNLHKLGATAVEYLADFYGPMTDGINAGDASDRLFVTWHLESARAVAAIPSGSPPLDAEALRASGATVAVDRSGDDPAPRDLDPGGTVLVAAPTDIEALRVGSPESANRWRLELRRALTAALDAGLRITDMTRDGWYVLEPER